MRESPIVRFKFATFQYFNQIYSPAKYALLLISPPQSVKIFNNENAHKFSTKPPIFFKFHTFQYLFRQLIFQKMGYIDPPTTYQSAQRMRNKHPVLSKVHI